MTDDELIQVYHDAQHKAIQHADATIEDAHLAGLRSVLERHEYVPHEPSTKEECRKRIDELHAEIKRIAWIAEGSPRISNSTSSPKDIVTGGDGLDW